MKESLSDEHKLTIKASPKSLKFIVAVGSAGVLIILIAPEIEVSAIVATLVGLAQNPAFIPVPAPVLKPQNAPFMRLGEKLAISNQSPPVSPSSEVINDLKTVFAPELIDASTVSTLDVDDSEKNPGDIIVYSGSNFVPNGLIYLSLSLPNDLNSTVETEIRADSQGMIYGSIRIPDYANAGRWLLTAIDTQAMYSTLQNFANGSITDLHFYLAANQIQVVQADLAVSIVDNPDVLTAGEGLTYNLSITNYGPDSTLGVVLTNTLPPEVEFVSASPNQGSCVHASGVITCDLGDIGGGGNTEITIIVTPETGGTITNSASVTSDRFDPDLSNNSDIETTIVHSPPDAQDDIVATDEDTEVVINVLANDTDPDGDLLTISGVSDPAHGTAEIVLGEIRYTPDADYNGADSFTYTASDGVNSDTATVNVTINPTNDPPNAVDDSATTDESAAVTVTVLSNDSDPEGDSLSVTGVTQGSSGSVVINGDNSLTYTPSVGFSGSDQFTYQVEDGSGGVDVATVFVTVNQAACAPNPEADLSGTLPTLSRGWILNTSTTCTYLVGIASYQRIDDNIDNQILYDYIQEEIQPDTRIELNITRPDCAMQVDLFYGEVMFSFAGGVRYGERKLASKVSENLPFCGSQPLAAETPPDSDGDTFTDDVDCDPLNASIYPGAPETADDGIDQDCDGGDLVSPPPAPEDTQEAG